MQTITRRTALTVAASAPLAALPAVATSAEPADPAVVAFERWRTLHMANDARFNVPGVRIDDAECDAMCDAESTLLREVFSVTPSTREGLAAQILASFAVIGNVRIGGDPSRPDDYDLSGNHIFTEAAMRSILAGHRALARA